MDAFHSAKLMVVFHRRRGLVDSEQRVAHRLISIEPELMELDRADCLPGSWERSDETPRLEQKATEGIGWVLIQ